jgi:hypothetical protein
MTSDEYNKLFHELNLNLVAFKPLMECNQEVLKLVNAAIAAEREACAKVAEQIEREIFNAVGDPRVSEFKPKIAAAIRARGQHD